MVGVFKLVLNYYLPSRARLFSKNIDFELPDVRFGLNEFDLNSDFLAEQIKVFWLGEPIREVARLVSPDVA